METKLFLYEEAKYTFSIKTKYFSLFINYDIIIITWQNIEWCFIRITLCLEHRDTSWL